MHNNSRRLEASKRNGFLDPDNHVIPGSAFVVAEIMVKTDLLDITRL